MLPEVGSTIVPPGFSFPSRSAASIIVIPIRSFTDPPGLRYSSLATTVPASSGTKPLEADERGVADEVEDGRILARHGAKKRTRLPSAGSGAGG